MERTHILEWMATLKLYGIRLQMNKIAEKRRRFGYPLAGNGLPANRERRRIGVMLERVGMVMNEKKLYRIYREEGLSVRRRRGRKRARGSRTPMPVPQRPNQRWSLDFLSDTFGACRKFRILAVNDDCCRENLGLIADTSISGERVARELDAPVRVSGKPDCIVSDRRRSENDPGDRFPEEGHRVHQQGDPEMGQRQRRRVARHRPRKAAAERLHRVLQRQPARRVPQRGDLRQPGRCPPHVGPLALRLQQCQAALLAGQPDPRRSAPDA